MASAIKELSKKLEKESIGKLHFTYIFRDIRKETYRVVKENDLTFMGTQVFIDVLKFIVISKIYNDQKDTDKKFTRIPISRLFRTKTLRLEWKYYEAVKKKIFDWTMLYKEFPVHKGTSIIIDYYDINGIRLTKNYRYKEGDDKTKISIFRNDIDKLKQMSLRERLIEYGEIEINVINRILRPELIDMKDHMIWNDDDQIILEELLVEKFYEQCIEATIELVRMLQDYSKKYFYKVF